MRTPTLSKRPWIAVAAVVAAAALLIAVAHQGMAVANTGPPDTPANPLAHLIVPDDESPRVRVSWDAPDNTVSSYAITRRDGQTFNADGDATTYSDHSVEPGTTYSYSVTAANDQGSSSASTNASASVPPAPSQPADFTATVDEITATDDAATVNLSWSASTVPEAPQCDVSYPLQGYTVLRSDGDDTTELAMPDSSAGSFADPNAAFGATYTYQVMARSAIGNSPAATVAVSVPHPPVLPATGLTATITDPFGGNVSLAWNAPSTGPEIAGYMAFRYLGTDPFAGNDEPTALSDPGTQTTLVDDSPQAGVTYSYIVIARSAHNVSEPSNVAVIEAPAPPTNLSATATDSKIDLSWTAPSTGIIVEYRVDRLQDGTWTTLTDTSATTHTDSTAVKNVEYRYRVQHRNAHGGSTWASSNTVTVLPVPAKVEGVSATISGEDIIVTWTAPTGTVDSYEVSYGPADSEDRQTASVASGTTSFTHSDNTEGVTYRYEVSAKNAAGYGLWSEPAEARRLNLPGTPADVSAAVSAIVIIVSWTAPESSTVDNYDIQYGISGGSDTETASVASTETQFVHQDPDGDTLYEYQVRARNDAGASDWTTAVTAMRVIPPLTPTGASAAISGDDILFSWNAPSSGIVDKHEVRFRQTETAGWTQADAAKSDTRHTHTGPTPGATYEYQVRTVNSGGNSEWTEPVTAVWYRSAAPPHLYKIRALGKRFIVNWEPSETPGVTSYELRQRIDGGEWTVTDMGLSPRAKLTNWSADQSLHEYAVRSLISDVTGEWSPTREAVIAKPQPVTGVRANREGARHVRLHWNLPDGNLPNMFIIEMSDEEGKFSQVASVPKYESTARVAWPGHGNTRQYRVKGRNHANITSDANAASTVSVTIPEKPHTQWQQLTDPDVTMLDPSTPKLTWGPAIRLDGNTNGHRIYRKETSDDRRTGSIIGHILAYRTSVERTYTDYTAEAGKSYEYRVAPLYDFSNSMGPLTPPVYTTTWD